MVSFKLGSSSLLENLKLIWTRVTFSRLTIAYIVFSLCHFIIQIAFQTKAFTINAEAASFLNDIIVQGGASTNGFPVLGSDLKLCFSADLNTDACQVIWDPSRTKVNNTINAENAPAYGIANSASVASSSSSTIATASSSSAAVSSSIASSSASGNSSTSATSQLSSTTSAAASASKTVTVKATAVVTVTSTRPAANAVAATPFVISSPQSTSSTKNIKNDDDDDDDESDDDDDDSDDESDDDDRRRALSFAKRGHQVMVSTDMSGQVTVHLNGEGYNNDEAILSETCLVAMNWPLSILDNTKREDIVFIAFQFWVLGMSIVALLNESIPHILASLFTHIGATAWAGFQIVHTANFRANFNRLINNGACKNSLGTNKLLAGYWVQRSRAEIPSLALNVVALFVSAFLTWKLLKSFGWQTFKRVGASRSISRIYKFVLTLSITIQLSVFFIGVTAALWIDQLYNGNIGRWASFKTLYQGVTFTTLILLLPWLITGWFAIRRELKVPMLVFLACCILYFAGWGAMFLSDAFRWTFIEWRFFSIMASISVLLTLMSFGMGLICRWNFDRGLPRYLSGQHTISDDDEFLPQPFIAEGKVGDIEKVEFPNTERPMPTYASAFGDSPPASMLSQGRMGPRFYAGSQSSSVPFEGSQFSVSHPPTMYSTTTSGSVGNQGELVRNVSNGSTRSGHSVGGSVSSSMSGDARRTSQNSMHSYSSSHSGHSAGRSADSHSGGGKRWVIE